MTVIDEMMMAMMVFLFLFRIFKPLWTLMFHFNFSSAIIRAATCKQEDPLQKKYKKKKNTPAFRRQYPKKKKKKKKEEAVFYYISLLVSSLSSVGQTGFGNITVILSFLVLI